MEADKDVQNDSSENAFQRDTAGSMGEMKDKKKVSWLSPKKIVVIIIVLAVIAAGYIAKGLFIAATVNGSPISRLAVVQELESRSGQAALDALINQRLIHSQAVEKGVISTEEEINAEIASIREEISAQGSTLEQMLEVQGLDMDVLREQIIVQKELEKLVSENAAVTDEEVDDFIEGNNIPIPEGEEAEYRERVRDSLVSQKVNAAASTLVDSLRADAKIRYFVEY